MWFNKLTETEIRDIIKNHIETLEYWFRRLINDELTNAYGANYHTFQDSNSNYIINKKIRDETNIRISSNAGRFPRWIDATTFDHLIDIICNPSIYETIFKKIFHRKYTFGSPQVRSILEILLDIRNRIYHLNPISIRQAEQSICYSNDNIDCIKEYYLQTKQFMSFNAPSTIKYSDSFGNQIYAEQGLKTSDSWIINLGKFNNIPIRCGDSMTIE